MSRAAKIDEILSKAEIPSAVILFTRKGESCFSHSFGQVMGHPAILDIVYDCASLTKPLITTNLILQEIGKGSLDLTSTLGDIEPTIPENLKAIPLYSLLTHSSGLRPWFPLYAESHTLEGYVEIIGKLDPVAEINSETHYSCLNYILLSYVLLQLTGNYLPRLARERIFKVAKTTSSSLHLSPAPLEKTAPTEDGDEFEQEALTELSLAALGRDYLIHGEVHDGNAYHCHSQTGNAGLFSTARDLVLLANQFMESSTTLDLKTIGLLNNYDTPWGPQRRTIGWQWACSPECSAGDTFPPGAIGHSGFTGTSIWIDIKAEEVFIILTNRIHPRVSSLNMNHIRRRIHNIVRS